MDTIVAIATSKHFTDEREARINLIALRSLGDAHIGVGLDFFASTVLVYAMTDVPAHVAASIHSVDDGVEVVVALLVDFDKRATLYVCHTCTTEDLVDLTAIYAYRSANTSRSLKARNQQALANDIAHATSAVGLVPDAM